MNKKTLAIAVAISAVLGTQTENEINDMQNAYQVFIQDIKED